MITHRLWRGLRHPQTAHPLFRRTVRQVNRSRSSWYIWLLTILAAPVLLLPALVFAGLSYSLLWSAGITRTVAQARQNSTYDLLCVTPGGALAVNWLICTGYLHHNQTFVRAHGWGLWLMRFLLLFLLASTVATAYFPTSGANRETREVLALLLFGVALVADQYQSVTIGALFGILVPTFVTERTTAQLLALGGLGLIHITSYLLVIVAGFFLLPEVIYALFPRNSYTAIALLFLQLLTFITIREATVYLLWRGVLARFGLGGSGRVKSPTDIIEK
jgi:hypothetical protein